MTDPDPTVDLEADDTRDLALTEAPTPLPAYERAQWRRGSDETDLDNPNSTE